MSLRNFREMEQLDAGDRGDGCIRHGGELGVAVVLVGPGDFELQAVDGNGARQIEIDAGDLLFGADMVGELHRVADPRGGTATDHASCAAGDGQRSLPVVLDHDAVVSKPAAGAGDGRLGQAESTPRAVDQIPIVDEQFPISVVCLVGSEETQRADVFRHRRGHGQTQAFDWLGDVFGTDDELGQVGDLLSTDDG